MPVQGKRVVVGVASVALSPHVPDPWGEDSGSEESSSGEVGSGSEGWDDEEEADGSSEEDDEVRCALCALGADLWNGLQRVQFHWRVALC